MREADVAAVLKKVAQGERWVIQTEEFETRLDVFCDLLSRCSFKSSDIHLAEKFIEVLAFASLPYFIRILKSAQNKNHRLIEDISGVIKNEQRHPARQAVRCRAKFLVTVGIYKRVFAAKRLRLILESLGEYA